MITVHFGPVINGTKLQVIIFLTITAYTSNNMQQCNQLQLITITITNNDYHMFAVHTLVHYSVQNLTKSTNKNLLWKYFNSWILNFLDQGRNTSFFILEIMVLKFSVYTTNENPLFVGNQISCFGLLTKTTKTTISWTIVLSQ